MRNVLLTIGGGAVFPGACKHHINLDRYHADQQAVLLEQHKDDGVVFFHGGADVMPQLYGRPNTFSYTDAERDVRYLWVWQLRKVMQIPFMAVCGGHQFVCAVNGGTLYQDLGKQRGNSHPGSHTVSLTDDTPPWLIRAMLVHKERVISEENLVFGVNSTHHQATDAPPPNATVFARAYDGVIEGLLYDDGLTVQWHPEYYDHSALLRMFLERF